MKRWIAQLLASVAALSVSAESRVSAPRPPWLTFTAESHYPPRHHERFNALFNEGHVQALRPAELRVRNFREPGSLPPVPGYADE